MGDFFCRRVIFVWVLEIEWEFYRVLWENQRGIVYGWESEGGLDGTECLAVGSVDCDNVEAHCYIVLRCNEGELTYQSFVIDLLKCCLLTCAYLKATMVSVPLLNIGRYNVGGGGGRLA